MSSVVVWETSSKKWMSDNHEGETHFFDSEDSAIQSACDMEKNKEKPDRVLVFKKNGSGISINIPVRKEN